MTHVDPLAAWTIFLGGLSIAALGLFVASLRPRREASIWFSIFALGLGGFSVVNAGMAIIHFPAPRSLAWQAAQAPFSIIETLALIGLALVFPRRLAREERRDAAIAGAVAGVLILLGASAFAPDGVSMPLALWSQLASTPAQIGLFVLLMLRFRRSRDPVFRREAAWGAAALTLFVALRAGYGPSAGGEGSPLHADGAAGVYALAKLVVIVAVALGWLASARSTDTRTGRAMAWLILAVALAGLILAAAGPYGASLGISRILMAAIFAYAIIQHQLLGIDVKMRWAISKSTIAAIFIAVFFIASEAAQQFFGAAFNSAYVGIAAAGALVFAMAPLHRAAERLAERAVPIMQMAPSSPSTPAAPGTREARYRMVLRRFLADGSLSREEERALAHLAADLGIDAGRAFVLREEVEEEIV